jgi:hypothetical protein
MISRALVFDHQTHLRHDMAPALGRPVPDTDAGRMRAVLTWMIAVLSNQVASDGRVAAHVTAPALTFPDWGTQRSPWRDSDVTITGDTQLAARFLDAVNVI